MPNFFDIELATDKPWVILGKGPSFSKVFELKVDEFYFLGLNEVGLQLNCDFMHVIDFDVIEKLKHLDNLIVPRYPNVNFKIASQSIFDLIPGNNFYWYHKRLARFFSAEAAFNLLALQGIKRICSLGIDGGIAYAEEFADLKPLRNKRKNFDAQFKEIDKIVEQYSLEYTKL